VLCQPSREEPFGLAALEAMALEKTVLASMVGGPSEFVPADAGVLVDPGDQLSLVEGMRRAIEIGSPNPAARAAAEERSAAREAERFVELLEAARR
jgi:glycosyltransferase involved in cell wall biosynthesis